MLGNEADARFIRDWYTSELEKSTHIELSDAPKGWRWLGAGCYRAAFLSPDGVVYKVQKRYVLPGEYQSQSNKSEAKNLRKYWLKRMPEGCRLPRWSFFELDGRGVMAMERFGKTLNRYSQYTDEGSRYWTALDRLQDMMYDLYDFHGGNLAVDEENQLLVPIDLGG